MYKIRDVLAGFSCMDVLKDLNRNTAPMDRFEKVPTYSNCYLSLRCPQQLDF